MRQVKKQYYAFKSFYLIWSLLLKSCIIPTCFYLICLFIKKKASKCLQSQFSGWLVSTSFVIISQAVSCISLNHSWVFYSQLNTYIYILKKHITLPLSPAACRSCPGPQLLHALAVRCSTGSAGKVQYKVLWIVKNLHKKQKKSLARRIHSCCCIF